VARGEGTGTGSIGSAVGDRGRLQRQARALGHPTRFAIFEHVARARDPVRVAALVQRFGLNHNAIRQHLMKLCEADLLVEELAARSGPGRPALEYRLAPEVSGTWGTASPYEQLAAALLDMAADGLSAREAGRRAGRRAARAAAGRDGEGPLEHVIAEIRRRGFEPWTEHGPERIDVVLQGCPFLDGTSTHPDIVCEIHRGLVEGILEELDSGLEVVGFQLLRPVERACRLELRGSADT
jgi:predicted ArsR family transcriptional regulator